MQPIYFPSVTKYVYVQPGSEPWIPQRCYLRRDKGMGLNLHPHTCCMWAPNTLVLQHLKQAFSKRGLLFGVTSKQQVVLKRGTLWRQESKCEDSGFRVPDGTKPQRKTTDFKTRPRACSCSRTACLSLSLSLSLSSSSSPSTWPSRFSAPENRLPLLVPQFGNTVWSNYSDWHRSGTQIFTKWTKDQSCFCGHMGTLTAIFKEGKMRMHLKHLTVGCTREVLKGRSTGEGGGQATAKAPQDTLSSVSIRTPRQTNTDLVRGMMF